MSFSTDRSGALYDRALGVLIEGGSSPSRGPANYGDYPLFIREGRGASIYDVDSNRYIDWMMAYGALPLGHAHPSVVEAVKEAASGGTLFAAATEIEIEVAEMIQRLVPSAERVRFANTGTEAAMAAVRLARGYTGRPKFIKFEGHYHGWYDDFLVNAHPHPVVSLGHRNDPIKIAESSGLNRHALEDTVVVPWNDLESVERAMETYRGQIAAVITEGIMGNMGVIPPEPGYLQGLRDLTRENRILLILDETVTGFRIAPGGCQEYYGIVPDISTFGKALGAGLPVAALVGRAEIMEALAWGGVLHYGTQNASRVGLYAARACLRELTRDGGAAFRHTWMIGDRLCSGLREIFRGKRISAIVQGVGPMFQIMFTGEEAVRDYRQFCGSVDRGKYQKFVLALFRHGVYMSPSAALHSVATVAHREEDVEFTLEAVREVVNDG
ncbi:MAG: aspartate aminotransferase family protein [Deltaproteobacteria bacterium]|nr:aspartate aminotransferase family protein [Deltaproteobacteria bacterium]MBW2120962.1 aspartate aminotransferase family protein [Deltaproteobacteria bacterium]